MKKSTKKYTSAGAYRAAVNSGKDKLPDLSKMSNKMYFAYALGYKTPGAYRAYMNGGEK